MKEEELTVEDKKTEKVRIWFYLSGAFFVFSLLLTFFMLNLFSSSNDKKEEGNQEGTLLEENVADSDLYPRLIDGVLVEEKNVNPPIIAVMIDNHVDARPQAGIDKANLVFEAEAEGGITRYMAFFVSDQEVEEIGPIRSARPYFIDWAKEFKALYVHVGGSPAALVKLQQENVFHINEFYNGSYFWRSEKKFAPHNVFSSFENLNEYINRNEKKRSEFESWTFEAEKDIALRPDSQEISVDFKGADFKVKWKYDKENNIYIRFLADEPHITMDGQIVSAKNVAIIKLDSEEIDDKLRLEMNNIGNGEAIVCHNGSCENGFWEKTKSESRTNFFVEDGSDIAFARGNTWVEVVKPSYEIEIK